MSDVLDHYLTNLATQPSRRGRRASPATQRAARADLQGFIHWWEQARHLTFGLELVLDQDLWDWQEHRQVVEGKKTATINRASASLRAFFAWAHATHQLSHNPATAFHDLPVDATAPPSVPPDGVAWLMRVASHQRDP